MASTIYLSSYLSLDSALGGAVLCWFGLPKRYWLLASSAVGFADGFALLCGWTLQHSIGTIVTPFQQSILFLCSALTATIMSKTFVNRPRLLIAATALVFSVDNLLAGSQLTSFRAGAQCALMAAIFSGLACFAGFYVAKPIQTRVRPRVWLALASLASTGIRFLSPKSEITGRAGL